MVNIPVKYIVTTRDAVDNIPIIDGQIICLSDSDGWYYDMNGQRRETSGDKYSFLCSDTIAIEITETAYNRFNWVAKVKEGSITETELEGNYLTNIKAEANRAIRAADQAEAAAERSATSAQLSNTYALESLDSSEDSSSAATQASGYATAANGYASAAGTAAVESKTQAQTAEEKAIEAARQAILSNNYSEDAGIKAEEAESWAVGGTSTREGEDANNAKYWALIAQQAAAGISGVLVPKGTILFEQLKTVSSPQPGWMFNISNTFETDDSFITPNEYQPAGTNVYLTDSYLWDCMAGASVTGVKGSAETEFRIGNVVITKADIGLDKVENLPPSGIIGEIGVTPAENTGSEVGTIQINEDKYVLKAPVEIKYLTIAEYSLLTEEEKMLDVLYVITDDGGNAIIDDTIISRMKTWSSYKIHQDVLSSATDEKVNVSLNTEAKAYLLGTTTTPTGTEVGTKSIADDSIYIGETPGELNVSSIVATGEIHAESVYSAVWNDYAEWFEKENENETFEPGTIVSWGDKGVVKATEDNSYLVAGVCSNSYGYVVGGEDLKNMRDNQDKFVPVALAGRVYVNVIGAVSKGDFIIPLDGGYGIAVKPDRYRRGTAVGKAIESKTTDDLGKVKILVMLA